MKALKCIEQAKLLESQLALSQPERQFGMTRLNSDIKAPFQKELLKDELIYNERKRMKQ